MQGQLGKKDEMQVPPTSTKIFSLPRSTRFHVEFAVRNFRLAVVLECRQQTDTFFPFRIDPE